MGEKERGRGGESGNGRVPRRNGPYGPLLRGNHLLGLGWGPGAFVELDQTVSHAFMTPEGSADTREEELSQVGECARNSESVKHGLGKLTDSLDSYGY